MSMEAGAVVAKDGSVLHWHLPSGRDGGSLPDSRELWDVIWDNRENLIGIAHSHPGKGVPGPSYTDVTTFAAIESALGRRLSWWITSEDRLVVAKWKGPGRLTYEARLEEDCPPWLKQLRGASYEL